MIRTKRFRALLVLLLIFALAAITANFFSRRSGNAISEDELLSPEVARKSTRFEYVERQDGIIVYKVRAETSTTSHQEVHRLENVGLVRYNPQGQPTDAVSGQQAVYDIPQKRLQFTGRVQITLSDGTRIFSDRVAADLNTDTVQIEESFRFEHGKASGQGEGLLYRIQEKQLDVDGPFELQVPAFSGSVKARANQAVYRLQDGQIDLIGEARIVLDDRSLAADRMDLFFSLDYQLEKILSSGHANLSSGTDQRFFGETINIFFDATSSRLQYFEVLAGKAGSSVRARQPAVYKESAGEDLHHLEAGQIRGVTSCTPCAINLTTLNHRGAFELVQMSI